MDLGVLAYEPSTMDRGPSDGPLVRPWIWASARSCGDQRRITPTVCGPIHGRGWPPSDVTCNFRKLLSCPSRIWGVTTSPPWDHSSSNEIQAVTKRVEEELTTQSSM
uniref:Uncharacterized protein n=1 Tax=Solanum tuberosum TaxID=4113 RepID=M1DZD3_SOLTU